MGDEGGALPAPRISRRRGLGFELVVDHRVEGVGDEPRSRAFALEGDERFSDALGGAQTSRGGLFANAVVALAAFG